jgi:hypothetical protein
MLLQVLRSSVIAVNFFDFEICEFLAGKEIHLFHFDISLRDTILPLFDLIYHKDQPHIRRQVNCSNCFGQQRFLSLRFDCWWSHRPIHKWALGWFIWVLFLWIKLFQSTSVPNRHRTCHWRLGFMIEVQSSFRIWLYLWKIWECSIWDQEAISTGILHQNTL